MIKHFFILSLLLIFGLTSCRKKVVIEFENEHTSTSSWRQTGININTTGYSPSVSMLRATYNQLLIGQSHNDQLANKKFIVVDQNDNEVDLEFDFENIYRNNSSTPVNMFSDALSYNGVYYVYGNLSYGDTYKGNNQKVFEYNPETKKVTEKIFPALSGASAVERCFYWGDKIIAHQRTSNNVQFLSCLNCETQPNLPALPNHVSDVHVYGSTVYIVQNNRLYYSKDGNPTWTEITSQYEKVYSIDQYNGTMIAAGSFDSGTKHVVYFNNNGQYTQVADNDYDFGTFSGWSYRVYLKRSNGKLYVYGKFKHSFNEESSNNIEEQCILYFDGKYFRKLGDIEYVKDVCYFNGKTYANVSLGAGFGIYKHEHNF